MLQVQPGEEIIRQLLNAQPDSVVWFQPVYGTDEDQVIDFTAQYCNYAASKILGVPAEQVVGERLRDSKLMDETSRNLVFKQCLQVWQTGQPVEFTYYSPGFDSYFQVQRSLVHNGILSITRDRTKEVKAEMERRLEIEKFKHMVETADNGLLLLDPVKENGDITDFTVSYCNRAGFELGKLPADCFGRTLTSVLPHLKDSEDLERHKQVAFTGKAFRYETAFRDPEGNSYGWFIVSLTKLGESVVSRYVNITEKKRSERENERQKLLLNNILTYSVNGISVSEVIRDDQGIAVDCRTILANDAAVRFTGLPREVYLSQPATSVEPNFATSPYFRMCLTVLETGEPAYTEYKTESTQRWLEISISRMDEDHFISVFTDITPKKEAQLKMETLVEELKRSNTNLEEFAYSASHDLQEPLRKIHYFSNRLKYDLGDSLREEHGRMFERMEASTERMRGLIEDLLTYSRVSYKPEQRKQVSLSDVVHQVAPDFENVITETGASVAVGALPVVYGDEAQLRQVFQNLLGNALKYRRSDVVPNISINSEEVSVRDDNSPVPGLPPGNYHCISIADNGIGFEQENAERIFKVFQRLVGRSEYEGNGIGLSIVQKVIKNHKGLVVASGRLNVGAMFQIYLPL